MLSLDTRCWNCGTVYDRLEVSQCPDCGNSDILPNTIQGSIIKCWRCEAIFNAANVTPAYFYMYTVKPKNTTVASSTICSSSVNHLHQIVRAKYPDVQMRDLQIKQSEKTYPTYPCPVCKSTILDNPKLHSGDLEMVEVKGFGIIFRGKNRTY